MKIQFQTIITQLAENRFGVACTAVVPTAAAAIEVRKWLDGALKGAAGSGKLGKTPNLILPADWDRGT